MIKRFLKGLFQYYSWDNFTLPGGYYEIWKIACPLIIMSASLTVMQFADRLFLARNSTFDVAAALPAGILYFTIFCFFSVTVNFSSALVAQLFGARDYRGCVSACWSGFYFAAVAGVIIGCVAVPLAKWIVDNSVQSEMQVILLEKEYLDGLRLSGVFVCMAAPFFSFFSGRGQTTVVAVINTIACALNILLDYMLIFGKFGAPKMGIYGAGIATTLCTLFSFLVIFICFLTRNQKVYPTRNFRLWKFDYIKRLLQYGTPAGLQVFAEVAAFALVTIMVGKLSADAQAATTIALSINNIGFIPLLGLADATAIVVGQYIGKRRKAVSKAATYRAWNMALLYMCVCGSIYIFLPETLTRLFSPEEAGSQEIFDHVVSLSRDILMCAAIFNFFDATKFIAMGALRGAGDTKIVVWISSFCSWVLMVPAVVLLVMVYQAQILTIWLVMTAVIGLEASLVMWRFRTGKWRHIELVRSEFEVTELPVSETSNPPVKV